MLAPIKKEWRKKRRFYKKVTELVSRVLYALTQQSSIFTARYRTVQALRLCHHESDGQSADKIGDQGVASDRVYSEPMLP